MSKHPTTSNRLGLMLKLAVEEKTRENSQPVFGFDDLPLPTEVAVEWALKDDGTWFNLDEVDFAHGYFFGLSGIYMIWNSAGRCIRVGQGTIAERLGAHRSDAEIRATSLFKPLFATWAPLPKALRDGVEKYLETRFKPATGARGLEGDAIVVNDPRI